jgi:hypothetical protein
MTTQEINPGKLMVFLCHGSEDKTTVRELYSDLREDGADPWLDEKNILPGQDWDTEIRTAVRKSDAILVCLSATSVSKEGYVQKEIRFALDVADEKPDGTIFVIPVKLGECDVPHRLGRWQWVNYFEEGGYEKILRALRVRAESLKIISLPGDGSTEVFGKPIDEASGRILYKSRTLRELLRQAKNGQIFPNDISPLPAETVVGISFEAMDEALAPFSTDARRAQEKEAILRMVGIRPSYHEWQEKNGKTHCFSNAEEKSNTMSEIQMIRVSSSNIAAIGYDSDRQVLRVAFLSGAIYEYYGIPEYLYEGLMNASSHGSYLNAYIKTPNYSYKQIR